MRIKKIVKNKIAFVLLIPLIFLLLIVLTACSPPTSYKIYGIGDMWQNNCLSITLDSVTDEKENGTLVLRISFIVIPANEWEIEEQDVYFFVVADEPIYAVKDRSTEESGFNVFDTVISAECVCVFVFQMPISLFYGENETETDMNRGVGVYFSPALFHFELELY